MHAQLLTHDNHESRVCGEDSQENYVTCPVLIFSIDIRLHYTFRSRKELM